MAYISFTRITFMPSTGLAIVPFVVLTRLMITDLLLQMEKLWLKKSNLS